MTESLTPTALLDAAEAAFATQGVDNASLRSIMRAAGSNPGAVHYHYGSREALARAVLDRILAPLQNRRLVLLDALTNADKAPSLHALVDALIRPDFETFLEVGQRNPSGARLIGAIYTRPSSFVKSLVEESFSPVAEMFLPYLMRTLPHLDQAELSWRIRWSLFGTLGALLSDEEAAVTIDNMESELARFLIASVGALTAPPSMGPSTKEAMT